MSQYPAITPELGQLRNLLAMNWRCFEVAALAREMGIPEDHDVTLMALDEDAKAEMKAIFKAMLDKGHTFQTVLAMRDEQGRRIGKT